MRHFWNTKFIEGEEEENKSKTHKQSKRKALNYNNFQKSKND